MEALTNFLDSLIAWCLSSGLRLVMGIVFILIAFKVIDAIFKRIEASRLSKVNIDKTVKVVGLSVLKITLKVICVIIFIIILGIETSTIAAAIASIGLTMGLALQGSLSNIASFVIILTMRQFRIGDYIEVAGVGGTVEKITLFYTVLVTPQNQIVSVPNTDASSSTCVNYSMKDTRRLDLTFSIAYENNFLKAKQIIQECIERVGLALPDPAPFVNIKAHNASSIDILVRVWTKSSDYWTMNWSLLEMIKMEFDNNDISIPYQQVDIHMVEDKPNKINYNIRNFEIKHVEADEINDKVEEDDDGILDVTFNVDKTPEVESAEECEEALSATVEAADALDESVVESATNEANEPITEPVEEKEEEYVPVKQMVVSGKVVRTKGQRQSCGKIIDKKKTRAMKKAEKKAAKLAKKQAKLEEQLKKTEIDA